MTDNDVTRSSIAGMNPVSSHGQGVGARHRDEPAAPWGGGYLDNYPISESSEKKSRDPRLDELSEMGIGGFWRSLAETIGYDAFILVWETLSQRADEGVDKHRVYIPKFESFQRYQRNRYIISLAENGTEPAAIQLEVRASLNADISVNHIHRLIRQNIG